MSYKTNYAKTKNHSHGHNAKSGLNLSASQHVEMPLTIPENIIIPSISQVSFGSNSILELRETGVILNNLALEFNVAPLTFSDASNPYFLPAAFWIDKVELSINNQVVSTIYGRSVFLENNLFFDDETRIKLNNGMGNYQSVNQLINKSQHTSSWFVNLKSLFDHHIPLTNNRHHIQIKLYMQPQNKLVTALNLPTVYGGGNINYCNLIANVSRLTGNHHLQKEKELSMKAHHFLYNNIVYQPFSYPLTANQTIDLTLTSIVGRVSVLFFNIIPSTRAVAAETQFNKIDKFELLNSSNSNIMGGSPYSADFSNYLMSKWFPSTYTQEGGNNSSYNGTVLSYGANVYCYSFSASPEMSVLSAKPFGSYRMDGNSRLRITTDSLLSSGQYDINVYAYIEQALEISDKHVKVLQL